MVVPCIVNNRLKVSGPTIWLFGNINCSRMTPAIVPEIRKNTKAVATYIKPRRL